MEKLLLRKLGPDGVFDITVSVGERLTLTSSFLPGRFHSYATCQWPAENNAS